MRIADAPRFARRGEELDCARNFHSVETILRLLDLMALLKLNRFHWHFADDEAFRLEVEELPRALAQDRLPGRGEMFARLFAAAGRRLEGHSPCRRRRIVAHARHLNIEVMPEIEMPAHSFALTQVIHGLRDPADTSIEGSALGYTGNTVNPAMDKTWEVLPRLASEVASWFPFRHLHLGCDELSKSAWQRSPAIAALKREGLAGNDDVQGWMMARMKRISRAQGAARGLAGSPQGAQWRHRPRCDPVRTARTGGRGGGRAGGLRRGDVCPAHHAYLDMAHTGQRHDWGANGVGATGLERTVGWNPVPAGAEDIARRFIGVQGNFWSEFTTGEILLWPMLMPRLLGVAVTAWSPQDALDGPGLRALADSYRASMEGFWSWNHLA
ncbi:MAG: family 20 glycosylhydrolase [Paracoccaceae bacterium]